MSAHAYELVRVTCQQPLPRDGRGEIVVDFGAHGRSSAVQVKAGKVLDLDALREMVNTLPFLGGMLVTRSFAVGPEAGFTLYERDSTEAEALAAAEASDDPDFEYEGPQGEPVGQVSLSDLAGPEAGGAPVERTLQLTANGAHYEVVVRISEQTTEA